MRNAKMINVKFKMRITEPCENAKRKMLILSCELQIIKFSGPLLHFCFPECINTSSFVGFFWVEKTSITSKKIDAE